MQLKDLVKTLDQMTDDELLARLRTVRHNREVIRPAATKRAERSSAKGSRERVSKVEVLLASLSETEREALLKQLEDQQ